MLSAPSTSYYKLSIFSSALVGCLRSEYNTKTFNKIAFCLFYFINDGMQYSASDTRMKRHPYQKVSLEALFLLSRIEQARSSRRTHIKARRRHHWHFGSTGISLRLQIIQMPLVNRVNEILPHVSVRIGLSRDLDRKA